MLFSQEGNLALAGLLLHTEPLGLVVRLEQLGLQFLRFLISVREFLLQLLDPADLSRLVVLEPHECLAHLPHFLLQSVKVLCPIVQLQLEPLDLVRMLIGFALERVNLLLCLFPQRLKLRLHVGLLSQRLVPLCL